MNRLLLSRLALLGLLVLALAVSGAQAGDDDAAATATEPYTRSVEVGGELRLDIAIRELVPTSGTGPDVWLVGVVHIGDEGYYVELQQMLDLYAHVLYESVMPPGAGRLRTETEDERVGDTRTRLAFLGRLVRAMKGAEERAPADLDALARVASGRDARLGHYVDRARLDAWGGAIRLLAGDGPAAWRLKSLGADGEAGGEGEAADVVVGPADLEDGEAVRRAPFDLQAEFASLLGLSWQGKALDYDRKRWVPSDMAIDEVRRAVKARGGDFSQVEEMLAGRGLTGVLVRVSLTLLRAFDAISGGAVRAAVKAELIRALGKPGIEPDPDGPMDEAVIGAIIEDRNTVVLEDLAALVKARPDLPQVAVFYGAGHMPDFETRLVEQGYRPKRTRWLTAMRVDLESAGSAGTMLRSRLDEAGAEGDER